VRQAGGEIAASSEPEVGTTLVVELPVADVADDDVQASARP